jgi:exopolyphosphatase/guanosine-5'-triphosphate,3'-diphosphate pyrophosphatase
MISASIDLGTNTCLLLIAELDAHTVGIEQNVGRKVKRVISDHSTVVRLGQGVDQARRFHPDAMKRTMECLENYQKIVTQNGIAPESVVAVATSQARDSLNGPDFLKEIENKTGFHFRILSGDQEAQATFLGGLLPDISASQGVVLDIGGGSTEFISLNGGASLDLGSVRFTERYFKTDKKLAVSDEDFWACQEAIDQEVVKWKSSRAVCPRDVQLVGVAGTVTTLAMIFLDQEKYSASELDQLALSRGDVHRLVEELKWRNLDERLQLKGLDLGRADVILAGAMILWRVMELLDFKSVRVSTRGLRFGVF